MKGVYLKSWLVALALIWQVGPATADIEGNFQKIGLVPERNSLDVVVFDEYLNFTCPHCNNFRKVAQPLKQKYGARLRINYIPILFGNQADHPLRLFFIAQREGREEEIKDLIFDAAFKFGVNIYDPAVVQYLARSSGLGAKFEAEANADWVTEKVLRAQQQASQVGIKATPTVVLHGTILVEPQSGMQAYVGNLDRIINQLLKIRS
ncbi:MAG: thioredoxin domain-containing protein [SAR324 cluster bacterium]|nr:thioredoxin domain-containing protein [SAR324 cluster bacterium]